MAIFTRRSKSPENPFLVSLREEPQEWSEWDGRVLWHSSGLGIRVRCEVICHVVARVNKYEEYYEFSRRERPLVYRAASGVVLAHLGRVLKGEK